MNTAEKLRFLADRAEDGKEFIIHGFYGEFYFKNNKIMWGKREKEKEALVLLNNVLDNDLTSLPQWSFTEDEKAILRNIPEQYKWIARDYRDSLLYVCRAKPVKHKSIMNWVNFYTDDTYTIGRPLSPFNHLFQSIQWEDEEPCEFRRYL